MNAPPFPTNPRQGQYFGNWVYIGSRWVCASSQGQRVITTFFAASAPYTPAPGLMSVTVETMGGGAGGGGAGPSVGTDIIMSGGGGGSGGYSKVTLDAAVVLGGVNVTIGQGGAGGSISSSAQSGGATSFGALCVANGGLPGVANSAGAGSGAGGGGGPPGVGTVAFTGAAGFAGETSTVPGPATDYIAAGSMGGSIWGGASTVNIGGDAGAIGANGAANSGAGGGGAVINQAAVGTGQYIGGAGGSGFCIVTEYCWADAMDDGCGCGTTTGGARVAIGWQGDND